jgi:N-terminal domain of anti-restriction factor ArdC
MTKERFDIHKHITDKIVSAIERGAGDFRLPWHRTKGNIMRPVNIASKKAYRGVNVVALWAYAEEFGYSSGTWGTYKQWSEAGAQVRKGEKAAFVVFYKELEFAADRPCRGGVRHHKHDLRLQARAVLRLGRPRQTLEFGPLFLRQRDRRCFQMAAHAALNHDSPIRDSGY